VNANIPATDVPGQQAEFLTELDANRRILYKVARAFGHSDADREDIVQEMVVQLWRAFPRYDRSFKFSTWTYRITLNVAISWQRRERTQTQHLHPDGGELLVGLTAASSADDDEDVSLLYRCIDGYDDVNKALLLLYLDGQSHQTIASVLGITTTNVGTKIARLKDRLRNDFRAAGRL
jgi:RNA polymerase sigma factor (sigma-70 family)